MLLIGTTINVVLALAAIICVAAGGPDALTWTLYLAPLPYNFFLYMGVWMAAPQVSLIAGLVARLAATLWMVVSLVI